MKLVKAALTGLCLAVGAVCILAPLYVPEKVRELIAASRAAVDTWLR